MAQPRAWVRPAVFGTLDGVTTLLGVILSLLPDPRLVLHVAFGLALTGAVGMAASQWKADSAHSRPAALVIGAATGLGTVIPALPFAFLAPAPARCACLATVLALTAGIAWISSTPGARRASFVQSYIVLAVIAAAVWAGQIVTGGS